MVNRRKKILETPKRRQRRRRRTIIKIIFFIFILLVLVGFSIWFFRTKYLQVSDVQVLGTSEIDPALVKAKAIELSSGSDFLILPKNQIFLYPRKQIETELRNDFKQISNVSVKLVGLNKIAINVQERSPFALYCINSCFFADETGYVYKDAGNISTTTSTSSTNTNYITFRDTRPIDTSSTSPIGTYPIDGTIFKKLESFARNIGDLKLTIKEVVIGLNNDVYILTDQGKITISIVNPLDQQFDLLKIALSQSPFVAKDGSIKPFGYVDVRFGNKIFYTTANDVLKKSTSTATSTL